VTKKRKPVTELRRRAEAEVKRKKPDVTAAPRALHELEVHQVELELQNEELRNTRQTMEVALERYTEVFDFAPIGYATLDLQGNIVEINHAGGELLGGDRSAFVGKRFALFVASRSLPAFDTLLQSAISRTTSVSTELDLRREKEPLAARLTASVLRRVAPTYMIAFEDISLRRQKEAELARTEAALRDLNRRKDDFVAMLSHELRNPLSPIRTSVEVLRLAPPGSEVAASAIDIIDRSATHMTRLVDDLLDVSRITRGKIELQREAVDVVALVKQIVADHQLSFDKRRFNLVLQIQPAELWVYGDRARLVQVITNLLANAEKFTPTGGRITISVEHSDTSAVIRVKDNGVGIAPDLLDELFQPFAQAPQPLDRNRGGLGLGLVMVKQLIELHGGRVVIRSGGLGKGTEVLLSLPAQAAQVGSRSSAAPAQFTGRRVLIVEDMHDNARSLEQALQLKGHEVRIAHDGWSGLAQMGAFKPEVVLCDIGLPDMDGYAFALRVREDRELRSCYLVALSGYARSEDIARARAAGFDRHIAKPANLDDLDRLLATLPPASPIVDEHNTLH
jgi:two-component system, chemotaxis family, CheB/CheR fusion protein